MNINRTKTFDAQVSDSVASERFRLALLLGFAAAALLLAMVGIYGVLSHSVAVRRREISIRLALGADKPGIFGLTLRQAAVPVAWGFAGACLFSFYVSRFLNHLLVGTRGIDPGTIVAVAIVCAAATCIASFVPANRAASIEPMGSLRAE